MSGRKRERKGVYCRIVAVLWAIEKESAQTSLLEVFAEPIEPHGRECKYKLEECLAAAICAVINGAGAGSR